MRRLLSLIAFGALAMVALAQTGKQPVIDYNLPQTYEIGGITVSGTITVDPGAVKLFAGLQVGDKIELPGDRIARAVRNLWAQKLFNDVRIEAAEFRGRTVFLHIVVVEKPRLSRFKFEGVSKSEGDKLFDEVDLDRGQQVNEAVTTRCRHTIRRYYVDKGYLNAKVVVREVTDTLDKALTNSVVLYFDIDRGPRVRIKDVIFNGNEALTDKRLRRAMKETRRKRWYNIFGSSKFISTAFKSDQVKVREAYNNAGYRNAVIVRDTMYQVSPKRVNVEVDVDEGQQFYFRNITFTGNAKYTGDTLPNLLNIKRGDVYNKRLLDSRLFMSANGGDISSLYMDDGYLSLLP
ncbi:MAG: hypothetical protein IPL52_13810 [Flavobacteriales bacterium]|nr:hypothetical protein [Flavobacteriales bacterium]